MISKEEKQKNFFKSIYKLSEREREQTLASGAGYKEVTIRLMTDSLEEIREWGEEE